MLLINNLDIIISNCFNERSIISGRRISMKIKLVTVFSACCLLLTGCANMKTPDQAQIYSTTGEQTALSQAATSVSQSLTQLGATEQAAYPPVSVSQPPNPASYGMAMKASIDWDGPIQPLVQKLANTANYKLHVLGNAPAIPVIVSVTAKKESVGTILRNVGYQAGKRATVVVFPTTHTIELRYAHS